MSKLLVLDTAILSYALKHHLKRNQSHLAHLLGLHRSTVSRWLNPEAHALPKSGGDLVKLACCLGLDPLITLTWNEHNFPLHWPRLRKAALENNFEDNPALSFVRPLIYPEFIQPFDEQSFLRGADFDHWPPDIMGKPDYSSLSWYKRDFCHSPTREQANFYASFVIEASKDFQLWHIAYQDIMQTGEVLSRWKPYGFFVRKREHLALFNYNTLTMQSSLPPGSNKFSVETFFGRGAAKFRIASIHFFDAELNLNGREELPAIRFGFHGE